MSRRFPTQIQHRMSRLLKANVFSNPPVWFDAVLKYPPLPLPPKAPTTTRNEYDTQPVIPSVAQGGSRPLKEAQVKPQPVYYLEDDIRRQFYADHPYEAFRPKTLVEADRIRDPHPIQGKEWTRLRQRSRKPTVEDTVQYAMNLHLHHELSVSEAYAKAVSQFRALRAEQYCATQFSIMEAEEFGAVFGPTEIQLGFMKERRSLNTWETSEQEDQGARLDRKRWKSEVNKPLSGGWTRGQEYTRLWQDNVRPDYSPEVIGRSQAPRSDHKDRMKFMRDFLEVPKPQPSPQSTKQQTVPVAEAVSA